MKRYYLNTVLTLFGVFLLFCIQLTVFAQNQELVNTNNRSKSVDSHSQDTKPESDVPVKSFAPILKNVLPSVVNIFVSVKQNQKTSVQGQDLKKFFDELEEHFGFKFRIPEQDEPQIRGAIGSGVIIDSKNGYVVTNHHVISGVHEGVSEIWITLNDNRKLEGKLIGSDEDSDLAVIQVKGSDLVECVFGDSSAMQVGDHVIAIGNPFSLSHTVTSGIVSALGRSTVGLLGIEDFIQTDASINRGNSGGALINMKGELIGINCAILTPNFVGNVGVGFAIPSNIVKVISSKLIDSGKVEHGKLGIVVQNASPEMLEAMGIKNDSIKGGGIVTKIEKNSPADQSKLKVGDVIVSVDDQQIISHSEIKKIVALKPIGTKIVLKVIRDKKYLYVPVQVDKFDASSFYHDQPVKRFDRVKGVAFSNISKEHELYGQQDGIVVVDIDKTSRAYDKGIRKGDLISSINQVPIKNIEAFDKELNKYKSNSNVLLNAQNKEGSLFVVLKLD